MLRKFFAFLAYNFYSWCFVWVFDLNTAYQFDSKMITRLQDTGFDTPPNQWGWGNHYIWRLLAAVIATLLSGFLAGAISRTRGGLTAAISNLPGTAVWIFMIYILGIKNLPTAYGDQEITSHTGMVVISILAIPLTTVLAYLSGENGAKVQLEDFGENGVLGIAGYHWIWLIFPIYIYADMCLIPLTSFLTFSYLYSDPGILSTVVGFIMFLAAAAAFVPLIWVYSRLRNPAETFKQALVSGGINFLILVVGIAAVVSVQFGAHWVLGKFS